MLELPENLPTEGFGLMKLRSAAGNHRLVYLFIFEPEPRP
jgi:hypothetical protein